MKVRLTVDFHEERAGKRYKEEKRKIGATVNDGTVPLVC